MNADIIVDLQYGDCGKGKVAHHLCKSGKYTHVIRYNGGCNAGHTIYHDGRKFVTHHIPCGVFFGVKSIIGPGCVVNVKKFFEEVKELEDAGIDTAGLIGVASNAHIITDFHMKQDQQDEVIGTTKRGNGPAYRDKYARKGVQAFEIPELEEYVVDMYEELHHNDEYEKVSILFEGAQGFGLDIDWGDYPYVTSSHCTVGGAILNGVPPRAIEDVWGVAKIYETYVGAKHFEGFDTAFEKIRNHGEEYGATTGRPRQINWMDWKLLNQAIDINGVNKLIINKLDVLEKVGVYKIYDGMELLEFNSIDDMEYWITDNLKSKDVEIIFSRNKDGF